MSYLDEAEKQVPKLVKSIEVDSKIPDSNKKLALGYVDFMQARGLNPRTIRKNLYCLAVYLRALGKKNALKADKTDIEKAMAQVENSKYSEQSKHHVRIAVKIVYKHFLGEDLYYPKQVAWIKVGDGRKGKKMLPEDILNENEILRMLEAVRDPRNKAIIALLFDSGIRVGELATMRVKDIDLAKEPVHIVVNGKTGMRRIPLMFSVPYLAQYMSTIKNRKPADYLWMAVGSWSNMGWQVDYNGIRKMLKKAGKDAKINKRIYPHLFRHSRASYYANKLTEQQLKAFFGWSGDSRMVSTYVHLSSRDIDNAILQANGMKVPEQETKPQLTVRACPRCQFSNMIEATYCARCGGTLDVGVAMNAQEAESKMKQYMSDALKDPKLIEDVVHAYLMQQREKRRKIGSN